MLKPGGYIGCHDMSPATEEYQKVPYTGVGIWNGDCWKALVKIRSEQSDLRVHTVDTDYGCAIISIGNQPALDLKGAELTYDNLERNRVQWLNLISPEQFVDIYLVNSLTNLLAHYVKNPNNALINYRLALAYYNQGQTASAVSYFIRAAERTDNVEMQYASLMLAAKSFELQGTRRFTVRGMLQRAISILPTRPEAYYQLSRFYRLDVVNENRWFDSYMISSIAIIVCTHSTSTALDYPGIDAMLFEKAYSAWWCGLNDESISMLEKLIANSIDDSIVQQAIDALTAFRKQ